MTNIKRQMTGRKNKAAGETFEMYLSRSCDYYLEKNVAFIEKTPEPFHITKKLDNGNVQGYYEKKGQPDYKGVLCDGTGISFEAKHTDSDKMRQAVITETQWSSLDTYEKFGAKCFVMVSMGLTKFYRVPWKDWKNMKEKFGRKYMDENNLDPYRLKERCCTILILEGVELNES